MLGFIFGILVGTLGTYLYKAASDHTKKGLHEESNSKSRSAIATPRSFASVNKSGSFLTDLIASIWPQINAAVSSQVKATVEPMFAEMLPGPLKSLHFNKLSLGDVPLRLDNCIVHDCQTRTTPSGTVVKQVKIDIDVIWDGQCDIELKADYVGRLGVQSLKLAGRLSILLQPLIDDVPVVGAVQYGFVNPPTLALDFTGLANVADMSSIKTTIQTTIADILAGMLVLPNRMMTKLDEKQSYTNIYQPPIGVARFSVLRGRGFTEEKLLLRKKDIPDVYCVVSLGATEIWTTQVVKNSTEPVWTKETADALLDDHDQILTIRAYDKDEGTLDKDDFLGVAHVTVGDILLAGKVMEVALQDDGGKSTGAFVSLHCDVLGLVSNSIKSIDSAMNESDQKTFNGVLTILLSHATDIPVPPEPEEELPEGTVAPPVTYFVKVSYGENAFFSPVVDGQIGAFDCAFRVPVTAKTIHPISVSLYRGPTATEEAEDKELIGQFEVAQKNVMSAPSYTYSSCQQVCDNGPSLDFSISLSGLQKTSGALVNLDELSSVSPTQSPKRGGSLAVTIVKGRGFKAETRRMKRKDIPDVYCKMKFGANPTVFRTKTQKNSFTPFWEETNTYRLLDHSQIISLEAFDEDGGSGDDDDFLGSARVAVGKILLAGGSTEVELLADGKPSDIYLTIRCEVTGDGEETESIPAMSFEEVESPTKGKVEGKVVAAATEVINESTPQAVVTTSAAPGPMSIELTAVSGSGFQIEKRRLKKNDVPDVYCKTKVDSCDGHWRTTTKKNTLTPVWNETKTFSVTNDKAMVNLSVFDEDGGATDKDDFLGQASVPLTTLIAEGECDLELLDKNGSSTSCTLTMKCAIKE